MSLRKIFVVGVIFTTVLSMSAVVAPQASASASAGDLIKMDGLSSTYYLGADGKRYVFPNEKTYFSWYADFSSVVTVPQSELESYPLGANVTVRPGTNLVKITTNPKVFAVEPGGKLVWVPDEATAKTLWGTDWAKRVIDVPDAFFTNYSENTAKQVTASAYPTGSIVKFGGADVFYIAADGTARKVASESSFAANRFNWSFVVSATIAMSTAGNEIVAAESTIVDTSSGAGGVAVNPNAGSGLSVSLSNNTAASGSIIGGQSNVDMGSFNLTASNDGKVTVNTIKLKRYGISSDSTLSALYLYDGATRLTENASVSSGYITFNNVGLVVNAGATKTVTVKAKVAAIGSGSSSGESVGVGILSAANVVTDGAAVSGSFPVNANLMSVANATLASASFGATTLGDAGVEAGETETRVWYNTVTIGTRAVYLESIRFKQIGSIATSDLKNFKFYVNGVNYGDAQQLSSDNYVQFNFATPIKLDTGGRNLEVKANVISGASKTYSMSLRYDVDVVLKDSEYGAYVSASGTIPATTGTQTVNSGTLSIVKATDSPSGDVVKDSTAVTLGRFEIKAYGEPMKIEYLKVFASTTNTAIGKIRNGALYLNGTQIGSTADLIASSTIAASTTTFSLGSSLIVTPGTSAIVEVRGDAYDSDGTNSVAANDQIQVVLVPYYNGAQRQVSLGFVSYVPSANVSANAVTVKTGTLTLSKYSAYGNQTIVVPKTNTKLGAYVLTGNNSEAVNVSSFDVTFLASGTFGVANLSDVYVKYDGVSTAIKSVVSTTSSWSISKVLPKNGTMMIELYGNVSSVVAASDSASTTMLVTGSTEQSGATATSIATGQMISVSSGAVSVTLDATAPNKQIVKANSTVKVAAYKFAAANDTYTVSEMTVGVAGTNGSTAIKNIILKDASDNVIATKPLNGTTSVFSGLNIVVPVNNKAVVSVYAELGTVGSGAGTSGANVAATLDSYKSRNSSGVEATSAAALSGNETYVYKAIPTIANVGLTDTILGAGSKTLAKFSISADGTIDWKKIIFTVTPSASVTADTYKLYDAADNTEITGTFATTTTSASFVATNEQAVSGTKSYYLKATVGGTIATGAYISTSIGQPSTFVTSNTYDILASGTVSFVWSDESANGHATSTTDWAGDYLVKNLSLDSQTLEKR